jgi:hypothetical protein
MEARSLLHINFCTATSVTQEAKHWALKIRLDGTVEVLSRQLSVLPCLDLFFAACRRTVTDGTVS